MHFYQFFTSIFSIALVAKTTLASPNPSSGSLISRGNSGVVVKSTEGKVQCQVGNKAPQTCTNQAAPVGTECSLREYLALCTGTPILKHTTRA